MTQLYDVDADTYYTPGACPVWRQSLLDGYVERRHTDPLYALAWLWVELYSRHPHARVKRWRRNVWAILGRVAG